MARRIRREKQSDVIANRGRDSKQNANTDNRKLEKMQSTDIALAPEGRNKCGNDVFMCDEITHWPTKRITVYIMRFVGDNFLVQKH